MNAQQIARLEVSCEALQLTNEMRGLRSNIGSWKFLEDLYKVDNSSAIRYAETRIAHLQQKLDHIAGA